MPALKEAIQNLIEDFITNESAVLKSSEGEQKAQIVSYSKLELGGDGVQFISQASDEETKLHQSMINATSQNRKAVWNFISKALS